MMDHSGVSYSDEGFQRYEMEVFLAFMHWGGFVVLHSPLWVDGLRFENVTRVTPSG